MKKKVFILSEHLNDKYEINFTADEYTHLRAFHACRPLKISDYQNNGITSISYQSALQDVKERVVCSYVSAEEAISEFKKEWSNLKSIHKRVWLQMNKEELLRMSSHYLIYGSEFINTLAMNLGCRNNLKQIGFPTIFYCDIPIEDIDWQDLYDIQYHFNNYYIYNLCFPVDKVLPQNIVTYEHPTERLVDPYGGSYKPNYNQPKNIKDGYNNPKCSKRKQD